MISIQTQTTTMNKHIGKLTKTNRGFPRREFKDHYDTPCHLQISSIATEHCLWLGLDEANPMVMATDAASVGVKTDETTGWVKYPLPEKVFISTCMHLSVSQVKHLTTTLQHWLKTREI
jgi:hypothetical protein